MGGHHKFAESDPDPKGKMPSWMKDTCCGVADEKVQAEHRAYVARQAADEAKQKTRSYNQKRSHRPDS